MTYLYIVNPKYDFAITLGTKSHLTTSSTTIHTTKYEAQTSIPTTETTEAPSSTPRTASYYLVDKKGRNFTLIFFNFLLNCKSKLLDDLSSYNKTFYCLTAAIAIAASIHRNNVDKYGPQLAIDGQIKKRFYHGGTKTKYPWHMTILPATINLYSVEIYNRHDCCGYKLRDVEVRAGLSKIDADFRGKITENILCGKFRGPGRKGKKYTVTCRTPILASVITIQIVGKAGSRHVLAIEELDFIEIKYSS